MKNMEKLWTTLRGFTYTINRFSITILLFVCAAVLSSYNISIRDSNNFIELLYSFIVGAATFMVLQMVYEHFYRKTGIRLMFCGLAVFAAILYYLIVEFAVKEFDTETFVRTLVLLFILLVCFIWIPSIKAKVGFSESFMVVFKAFFIVVLYSLVLFLGISLIIMAFDTLIAGVDSQIYSYIGNIILYVYAPIHFLSLIPVYPEYEGKKPEGQDSVILNEDNMEPSKFLEGLVSYIIIPVTAVFTVILLLYIILNITGDFWKDNLMEPLLVAYAITVIVVYQLAFVIRSKPALYFRKIFPKVLIPVVLFQTISSALKIGEQGITSGRYYVIIFGVFATISAMLFSIRPEHKNNVIAPVLIALSLVSILPPVDAFTVSKHNQINRLKTVLEENDMFQDDKITPNKDISTEDKQIIIDTVNYLNRMDYAEDISWLHTYNISYDFERVFGFPQYGYGKEAEEYEAYRYYLPETTAIDISGYDFFIEAELVGRGQGNRIAAYLLGGQNYILEQEGNEDIGELLLKDGQGSELIRYPLNDIFNRFRENKDSSGEISMDEAEFKIENDKVILRIVARSLSFERWKDGMYQNINAYIMVKIK